MQSLFHGLLEQECVRKTPQDLRPQNQRATDEQRQAKIEENATIGKTSPREKAICRIVEQSTEIIHRAQPILQD